jgi:hypothetical protein
MKAIVKVGEQNIIMEMRKSICLNCKNCDLETWEKKHWDDKCWTCPAACKTMGVCNKDLIACSLFEPR